MGARKVVVLTLDGWSANFLGPYGNTWVETSALNGLARDALLIEYAYADSIDLATGLASLWQGRHTLCSRPADAPALGDLLSRSDLTSHLITDDATVAHSRLAARMSTVTFVEVPASDRAAADAMQTQFGQFLALVAESLETENADCVWIHAQAFSGSWDAPFELRLALTDDEEDPDPSPAVAPPGDDAWSRDDPDTAWSLARAYAAQVMSVDRCLEFLFEILDDLPKWRDALWIVTSPRGYPLGEHNKVGLVSSANAPQTLHGEVLHVPLFVRQSAQQSLLLRSQAIAQPVSILPTILDWLQIDYEAAAFDGTSLLRLFDEHVSSQGEFDRAVSRAENELSIRTPGWFMRLANCGGVATSGQALLYVKPDDRWEANEVADRCREVVDALRVVLHEFVTAAKMHGLNNIGPLPELLLNSTM